MTTKTFTDFLKKHLLKKDSGDVITNTRIGDKNESIYGGSYHINDIEYSTFLQLYFRDVVKEGKKEYLTEKQLNDNGALLIDLDFKYNDDILERKHTSDDILKLLQLYFHELNEMYQFDIDGKIPVYILEKPSVNRIINKKITKDGIHIIIGLKVDRLCQIILRDRIIKKIETVWNDLPIINSWDDVFDEGITKGHVNWQLYGSRKPGNEAYQLTGAYNVYKKMNGIIIYDEIDIETINNNDDNMMKLSARYMDHPYFFFDTRFIIEYEKRKDQTLIEKQHTKTLSVNTNNMSYIDYFSIKNSNDLLLALNSFLDTIQTIDYELREAYNYTMILPIQFYGEGSYLKWIRVGWALCNKSSSLFIVWIFFSSKQDNFDYSSISDLWDRWQSFDIDNSNGITIRSIMYWAKEYNPTEFSKLSETTIDYYIDQTLSSMTLNIDDKKKNSSKGCGDFDLANVLYQLYKNEYVCASVRNNIWYRFYDHKWSLIDSGTTLRKSISLILRNLYYGKARSLSAFITTLSSDDVRLKSIKKKIDNITSICERCSSTSEKKNIMTEAKELFYDEKFLDKLDQNPYLMCFKNRVIDFKTKEIRSGRPDDYLSRCTNINYIYLNEGKDSIIINEIQEFMKKLFPEKELLRYMWDHLASTLIGTCKEQTINMYVGVGQNGKSVLVNLMELVLGEYKGDVPLSLITQQRTKIGGLSPELVQLKGVRYAVIQEPSKGDKINEGIMKQLTGGDPVQARSPYMIQTLTYTPQFKLVVCSNEFMDIQSQDHGTWRRIRVVDFESLFTENPVHTDIKKPYQFLLDKDIKEKFHSWKEVLASILVTKAFETNGNVKDCKKVLASSRMYRESQDSITEFLNSRICPVIGGCLSKIVVNEQFREWFASNRGGKAPTMKEVIIQADKLFGNSRDGVWEGYQLKPHFVLNNKVGMTMEDNGNGNDNGNGDDGDGDGDGDDGDDDGDGDDNDNDNDN